MPDLPLVSIIVTFYNNEAYVEKCINSILGQTYSNIEVIAIDDGSSDGTFSRLSSLAEANDWLHAFSIVNCGPGAARNVGLSKATGDMIMFVDGDDYIFPWSVDVLADVAISNAADLVISEHIVVRSDEADAMADNNDSCCVVLSHMEAAELLLYEEIVEAPWAKLYSKRLLLEHPFPEGRFYEDVAWFSEVLLAANRIALSKASVYAYVMSDNSVTRSSDVSIQQAEDLNWATERMLGPILDRYPNLEIAASYRRALELARLHRLLTLTKSESALALDEETIRSIDELYRSCGRSWRIGLVKKSRINLLRKAPKLHDRCIELYKHVRGRGLL